MRIDTLARMAGQIAANCVGLTDKQAAEKVATHLRSFWTPAMIEQLTEYGRAHPGDLDPRVDAALSVLAQ